MKIIYILVLIFCFANCKKIYNEQIVATKDNQIEKPENDTILKEFYPNNKIKNLIIRKDSLKSTELQLSYYKNGNLKEKGLVGIVSNKDLNTKMSIETWFYYDALKHLDSTIYYDNSEYGKDFIEKKIYFKEGKIQKTEMYNNYRHYPKKCVS
jgi:antitoxin component YwqK of YwqJK toxin-antitoxin module